LGINVGNVNIAGVSLYKLYMLLETHTLDILCLQETWMSQSTVKLDIPGYQVYEERRAKGGRGGIAMIIRKGIKVIQYIGNEYAQGICIQTLGGDTAWIGNVYLPPVQNM
jgi:exonuclease III